MKRVKVMHPITNQVVDCDMPEDMTIQELVDDLIESGFINSIADGYQAVLKDGGGSNNMDLSKTLLENGGADNSTIRLLPGFQAG